MNQLLALRVLSRIMEWPDDRARQEFDWLKLMARFKYDGYRDFQAGMRFTESLATWLQQFKKPDRETAYALVRLALVYISSNEMVHLVEQFYPRNVVNRLFRTVATECRIPPYRVLVDENTQVAIERLRRQTLFMGLSDGARIDTIRHANTALLTNEQIVQGTQVDRGKWRDLLANLRQDLDDSNARFRLVFLIDDFTATGTSFLRFDDRKQEWKGKLPRFRDSVEMANNSLSGDKLFDDGWELCIHHYITSSAAAKAIEKRLDDSAHAFPEDWASSTHLSFGMLLPPTLPINADSRRHESFLADFRRLTEIYYDPAIQTEHTAVGGVTHLGLGYGACALPVVLEHNTPNNAIALLWAETDGGDVSGDPIPAMRPLFRRRQRHT